MVCSGASSIAIYLPSPLQKISGKEFGICFRFHTGPVEIKYVFTTDFLETLHPPCLVSVALLSIMLPSFLEEGTPDGLMRRKEAATHPTATKSCFSLKCIIQNSW